MKPTPGWQPNTPAVLALTREVNCRDRVHTIFAAVAETCGVDADLIRGPSRYRSHVAARHIAMWLVRQATPLSLPEMGRRFGARHYTSVLYAVRTVDRLRAEHETIKALTDKLLWQVKL